MSRTEVLLLFKGLARGGAELLVLNAARHLDTAEFQYEVAYILPHLDALAGDLERAGLPVHCLGGTRHGAWISRLRALVRDRETKIVHGQAPYAAIGARLGLRRSGGPRFVYTEHNVWEAYHPLTRRANRMTLAMNDHIFAVSNHVRDSMRPPRLRFHPMPPIETLYHGLDLASMAAWESTDGVRESLGIPNGVPVIGTVANFRPEKGHQYLLEAAVRVRRSFPDARFVLVGHGPLEASIRSHVLEARLQDNVIFAGARDDAPRLTASFDLFVLPSIYEGLSIALIEALCVGTPAIVTSAGGVTEVISDRVNGVVVPPRDPVALGDAIVEVLNDSPLRQRLVAAGKARAADFDIRTAVRRIEDVYREVLG